jgi:flagellar biosynthesis protein FliQ
MKKNILIYGLIMGIVLSIFTIVSINYCYQTGNFEGNATVGYAVMIAVFSFIFVGVRNYRDKFNGGVISFGEAFKMGLGIVLIASTLYVGSWLIYYHNFVPDFMDKYSDIALSKAKASGATQAQLDTQIADIQDFKEMYKKPFFAIGITYLEILPVGLIIALFSALILKKKQL